MKSKEDKKKATDFLATFPNSLFCYIPDDKALKLPVVHGLTYDAKRQEMGYGVFFSVNGFHSVSSRSQENLKNLNGFYVDIDAPDIANLSKGEQNEIARTRKLDSLKAWKRDVMEDLGSLAVDGLPATHIVETRNGFHVCWLFKEPIFLDDLKDNQSRAYDLLKIYQQTERAIARRFNGDMQAVDAVRVLRVPGTLHLKDPGHPFKIDLVYSNLDNVYTFKEVRDFFLSYEGDKQRETAQDRKLRSLLDANKREKRNAEAGATLFRLASTDLPQEVFDELERLYPLLERPSIKALLNPATIPEGERNMSLVIAVSALRRSGMSETEAKAHFLAVGYNGLSQYEINSVVSSCYRLPEPYDFGWNHPLIEKNVTPEERARVCVLVKNLAKQSEKRSLEADKERVKEVLKNNEKLSEDELEGIKQRQEKESIEYAKEQVDKDAEMAKGLDKKIQDVLYRVYDQTIIDRDDPPLKYVEGDGFYEYEDGIYKFVDQRGMRAKIMREMLKDDMLDYRNNSCVDSIITRLTGFKSISIPAGMLEQRRKKIAMQNGLLDIETRELEPFNPNFFTTTKLPIEYLSGADCPLFKKFIEDVTEGEQEKKDLLQEMAGYCLTADTRYQVAFILLGSGANGKSTFVDILADLVGSDNRATITFKDMHSQFGLINLQNKLLNVTEEISRNYFESDMIKKLITGAEITADRKFGTPCVFRPYAKYIFAVNALPKINENSYALFRRFIVIKFSRSFKDDADVDLPYKLKKELPGIFIWALEGLKRLREKNGFSIGKLTAKAMDEYKQENSPLVKFLLDPDYCRVLPPEDPKNQRPVPAKEVYDLFKDYLKDVDQMRRAYNTFVTDFRALSHSDLANMKISHSNGRDYISGVELLKRHFINATEHPF